MDLREAGTIVGVQNCERQRESTEILLRGVEICWRPAQTPKLSPLGTWRISRTANCWNL